ncbi:MAG: hypothetical protein RL150_178 [Candidatus Parcubacteria bacterium]|jgi:hypothetical protein
MQVRTITLVGIALVAIINIGVIAKRNKKPSEAATTVPTEVETFNPDPPRLTIVSQETDRQKLFDAWYASAERVASESGNGQAHEILAFIKKNGQMSEALPDGNIVSVVQPEKAATIDFDKEPWFGLYMMRKGDERLSMERYAEFYNSGEAGHASYSPERRLLTLKSHVPMSWISQGILMLHEGMHAKEYLTRQYNVSDATVWCDEERKVYNFQNELFRSVFGKTYDERIEALAAEFTQTSADAGKKPGEHLVLMNRWYSEFDEVLPPVESEHERLFRNSHLWIHGAFRMLELAHPRTNEQEKVRLLLWIRQYGAIPTTGSVAKG